MPWSGPFTGARSYTPQAFIEYRSVMLPMHFGDVAGEYDAARAAAAVFDRSDRGRILATGQDRKPWLHGLVTNAVTTLDDGSGNYAFAIDARGRTRFDLNVLSWRDELWLDLDRAALSDAMRHMDRYLFAEQVKLADVSESDARLGVSGSHAAAVAAALGVGNFAALPSLAHRPIADGSARLVRHDFAGAAGFELIAPRGQAQRWWDRVVELGCRPAGMQALDALRIEAGIPWLGRDLDDQVIPAETGQIERGISYVKGCYVGYEVLERMRSRGALARRLVRLSIAGGDGVPEQSPIRQGGSEVGRITSLVCHPKQGSWVGLGYLKTALASLEGLTVGEPARAVRVTA